MASKFELTIDRDADCAYFYFSGAKTVSTRSMNDEINVDIDAKGNIVGLELLTISAEVPIESLTAEFNLSDFQLSELKKALASL